MLLLLLHILFGCYCVWVGGGVEGGLWGRVGEGVGDGVRRVGCI